MPKKKAEQPDKETLEKFERALRNALNTPPEKPRAKAKRKSKRRAGHA